MSYLLVRFATTRVAVVPTLGCAAWQANNQVKATRWVWQHLVVCFVSGNRGISFGSGLRSETFIGAPEGLKIDGGEDSSCSSKETPPAMYLVLEVSLKMCDCLHRLSSI